MAATTGLLPNVEFKRLVARIGSEAASELMGLGRSTVTELAKAQEIRAAYENLASLANRSQVGTPVMLAVKAPADKLDLLKTFLKGAECQFMEWRF
jgi:hypothetical protein